MIAVLSLCRQRSIGNGCDYGLTVLLINHILLDYNYIVKVEVVIIIVWLLMMMMMMWWW